MVSGGSFGTQAIVLFCPKQHQTHIFKFRVAGVKEYLKSVGAYHMKPCQTGQQCIVDMKKYHWDWKCDLCQAWTYTDGRDDHRVLTVLGKNAIYKGQKVGYVCVRCFPEWVRDYWDTSVCGGEKCQTWIRMCEEIDPFSQTVAAASATAPSSALALLPLAMAQPPSVVPPPPPHPLQQHFVVTRDLQSEVSLLKVQVSDLKIEIDCLKEAVLALQVQRAPTDVASVGSFVQVDSPAVDSVYIGSSSSDS